MRNKSIMWLLVILASACHKSEPWVHVSIDGQVEAQFPLTPDTVNIPSRTDKMKLFSIKDDQALYQIIRTTIRDSSTSLKSPEARREYYDGLARILLLAQQGSQLTHRTYFATPAGEGMDLEFTAIHQGTGKLVTKYNRSLLVGRVGYSFSFVPLRGVTLLDERTDEQRRKFFASIAIK